MKTKDISRINEANLILRHFVNLSARLLPFLDELQRKKNPSLTELRDRNKIIDVYENYSFDTCTSEKLLNSNILDLIKETFEALTHSTYYHKANTKNKILCDFLKEHKRLSDDWYYINSN